jgi:hypothetical protein
MAHFHCYCVITDATLFFNQYTGLFYVRNNATQNFGQTWSHPIFKLNPQLCALTVPSKHIRIQDIMAGNCKDMALLRTSKIS